MYLCYYVELLLDIVAVKYVRPVIILGPLGERFMEDLVAELPEKFAISATRKHFATVG